MPVEVMTHLMVLWHQPYSAEYKVYYYDKVYISFDINDL